MNDAATWWQALGQLERTLVWLGGGIVAYLVYRILVLRVLTRFAESTDNDLDDRLLLFVRRFFGIVLLFAVVLGVMHANDIEVSPLLAGAGIAGIAVGFAAKETLADILAGIFLIADRPMRVGDRVKVEFIGKDWGGWGDVVDIGLRRTRIRNTDGVVVNYPNALLASSVITNFSDEKEPRRVRVRFAVDYAADIPGAKEAAAAAVVGVAGVRPETVDVVTRSIWEDTRGHLLAGVLLEVRYRIDDVRERTRIRSRALEAILAGLRERGVPLAAPRVRVDDPG